MRLDAFEKLAKFYDAYFQNNLGLIHVYFPSSEVDWTVRTILSIDIIIIACMHKF